VPVLRSSRQASGEYIRRSDSPWFGQHCGVLAVESNNSVPLAPYAPRCKSVPPTWLAFPFFNLVSFVHDSRNYYAIDDVRENTNAGSVRDD